MIPTEILPAASCGSVTKNRPRRGEVVTYFIRYGDDGPVKIGRTANLIGRLHCLQGGSPLIPLVAIGYIYGDQELELQGRFRHRCICGEWFEAAPDLLSFIRREASQCRIIRCDNAAARRRIARPSPRRAARGQQ